MTPACINCLYHRGMMCECRNPDSEFYRQHMPVCHVCNQWEYEYEFEAKKGEYEPWVKRVTHSGQRKSRTEYTA